MAIGRLWFETAAYFQARPSICVACCLSCPASASNAVLEKPQQHHRPECKSTNPNQVRPFMTVYVHHASCVSSSPCTPGLSSLSSTEVIRDDRPFFRFQMWSSSTRSVCRRPRTPSDRASVRSDSCTGWSSDSCWRRRQGAPSARSGRSGYSSAVTATRWTPSAAWCVGAWSGHTSPGRVGAAGREASRRCMSLGWPTL
jgi:hypothetical protein